MYPSVRAVDIDEAHGIGNAFPFVELGLVLAWAIANLFRWRQRCVASPAKESRERVDAVTPVALSAPSLRVRAFWTRRLP